MNEIFLLRANRSKRNLRCNSETAGVSGIDKKNYGRLFETNRKENQRNWLRNVRLLHNKCSYSVRSCFNYLKIIKLIFNNCFCLCINFIYRILVYYSYYQFYNFLKTTIFHFFRSVTNMQMIFGKFSFPKKLLSLKNSTLQQIILNDIVQL